MEESTSDLLTKRKALYELEAVEVLKKLKTDGMAITSELITIDPCVVCY